jgi:general stress protein YciG
MAGNTSKRGFASMDKEKQRAIAAEGGRKSGGNFARNRKRASEAGKKGGEASHRPSSSR